MLSLLSEFPLLCRDWAEPYSTEALQSPQADMFEIFVPLCVSVWKEFEGVDLLAEVCRWGWALKLQLPSQDQSLGSTCCLRSGSKLSSYGSSAMPVFFPP